MFFFQDFLLVFGFQWLDCVSLNVNFFLFILLGVCWAPLICRFFSPPYSGNVGPLFLLRSFLSLSPLSFKVAIRLWALCILGMLYDCPSFWHCFSFFFNDSFFQIISSDLSSGSQIHHSARSICSWASLGNFSFQILNSSKLEILLRSFSKIISISALTFSIWWLSSFLLFL